MSVEDHALRATGHEHKYEAIVGKYGPYLVRTLAGQTVYSLGISAGLNAICIPMGLWELDWTTYAFTSVLAAMLGWGYDGIRAKYHGTMMYYHATSGQIPHMRS